MVNQKLALRPLQQMGYRAGVAANGIEAIQCVERQPPRCGADGRADAGGRTRSLAASTNAGPTASDRASWQMTANAMGRPQGLPGCRMDYVAKPVTSKRWSRSAEPGEGAMQLERPGRASSRMDPAGSPPLRLARLESGGPRAAQATQSSTGRPAAAKRSCRYSVLQTEGHAPGITGSTARRQDAATALPRGRPARRARVAVPAGCSMDPRGCSPGWLQHGCLVAPLLQAPQNATELPHRPRGRYGRFEATDTTCWPIAVTKPPGGAGRSAHELTGLSARWSTPPPGARAASGADRLLVLDADQRQGGVEARLQAIVEQGRRPS